MMAQQAIKVAAGDLTTDMIRGFSRPQTYHAQGELDPSEASVLRVICAETLAYRINVRQRLAQYAPRSAQAVPAFDLVPDHILHEFACPSVPVEPGELTGVELAIGSLYFSDICGELLGHRLAEGIQ